MLPARSQFCFLLFLLVLADALPGLLQEDLLLSPNRFHVDVLLLDQLVDAFAHLFRLRSALLLLFGVGLTRLQLLHHLQCLLLVKLEVFVGLGLTQQVKNNQYDDHRSLHDSKFECGRGIGHGAL